MFEFKIGAQFAGGGMPFKGLFLNALGCAVDGTVWPDGADSAVPPIFSGMPEISSGRQFASRLWASSALSSAFELWDHQQQFVDGVDAAHNEGEHPWLGIASPMQTGKSQATVPIIDRIGDSFERVIVLCDSRAAFAERKRDLESAYGSDHIGQFNGKVKNPQRVNVAMLQTLVNHLDKLSPDDRTLIILDEAITTQQPTVRQILYHFGLGTVNTKAAARSKKPLTPTQLKRGKFIPPTESKHLLVGLSGTGGGLDGYHVIGRYDMLDAIEDERIRHLIGDQVYLGSAASYRRANDDPNQPEVTFEEKKLVDDTQIWWKATPENARILAKIYFDRAFQRSNGRDMVFVPTIYHGTLMTDALKEEYVERGFGDADAAEAFFGFVHSGGTEEVEGPNGVVKKVKITRDERLNDAEIEKWRAGGTLVSIAKLNRSFPATGAGVIFHTYQTTSDELFAQRTGRGWGNNPQRDLPALDVLEATWSRHQKFSNLAKLLGFVDYPTVRLDTRDLMHHIPQIRKRRKAEGEMAAAIDAGRVAPMFQNVFLVMDWRERFRLLAGRDSSRIAEMARQSRIPEVYLQGFAQGGLPTRLAQIEAIAPFIGDVDTAIGNWVNDWRGVIEDLTQGVRFFITGVKTESVPEQLLEWKERVDDYDDPRAAAEDLDKLLVPYFGVPLSGDELAILQGAVSAYADAEGWKSAEIPNKQFPEDPPKKISANALGAAMFGQMTEPQRVNLTSALIVYFGNKADEVSAEDNADNYGYFDLQLNLIEMGFKRKGWSTADDDVGDSAEVLRALTREALSRRYGEEWPQRIEVDVPAPSIHRRSTLYKWLTSDEFRTQDAIKNNRLFIDAARLLYALHDDRTESFALDMSELGANSLLMALGWNDKGSTKGEKRRYEVRRSIAQAFLEPTPSRAARKEAGIERMSKKFIAWLHGDTPAGEVSPKLSAEIGHVLKRAAAYIEFQKKDSMHRIPRSVAKHENNDQWRKSFTSALESSIIALRLGVGERTKEWGVVSFMRDETIDGDLGNLWSEPSTSFHVNSHDIAKKEKRKKPSKPQTMDLIVNVTRALIHAIAKEKDLDRIYELEDAVKKMIAALAEMARWPVAKEIRRALAGGKKVRSDLELRMSLLVYFTARYGEGWPGNQWGVFRKWLSGATQERDHLSLQERRKLLALIDDMGGLEIVKFEHDNRSYTLYEAAWDYISSVALPDISVKSRSDAERLLLLNLRSTLVTDMGGGLDLNDVGYKGRPPTSKSELVRWLKGERISLTHTLFNDITDLITMKKADGTDLFHDDNTPQKELLEALVEWHGEVKKRKS